MVMLTFAMQLFSKFDCQRQNEADSKLFYKNLMISRHCLQVLSEFIGVEEEPEYH